MNSDQMVKAIQTAFNFHPFGMSHPAVMDHWVYGPLFAVKVENSGTLAFAHLSSVWKPQPEAEQGRLETLMGMEPESTKIIALTKDKHSSKPKCTYRVFDGAGTQYPLELCFPLVQLAKKLGVDRWTTTPDETGIMVFGYKEDKMIAIMCARRVVQEHFLEEEK